LDQAKTISTTMIDTHLLNKDTREVLSPLDPGTIPSL